MKNLSNCTITQPAVELLGCYRRGNRKYGNTGVFCRSLNGGH